MSGFRTVRGFEEVWRPPAGRRVRPEAPGPSAVPRDELRARLARLVQRPPEVVVKITGRTRDPAHLVSHFRYLTRNGDLEAQTRDGARIAGLRDVDALANGWSAIDLLDPRRRLNSPLSVAVVLSMPRETDPARLQAAAEAFAEATFGETHDYLLVLHTDAGHPHAHLTVRARGDRGERLNPRKADLEAWRQRFAAELRDRGVEAEATPRRARGVTRKGERTALRKLRERFEAGQGPMATRVRAAWREAGRLLGGEAGPAPWERAIRIRQQTIRRLYLAQARLLAASDDPDDRRLGREVERFLAEMPAPDTQRLALARELRAAQARGRDDRGRSR